MNIRTILLCSAALTLGACHSHSGMNDSTMHENTTPHYTASSYTVLFDHDKSDIRANERASIDRAVQEIDQYDPARVTVTGYTDSSGSAAYNHNLSHEREQAVSQALLAGGMKSQLLDREARGEYEQAVQTNNGVRNQDNRRVVIDFWR